MQTAFFRPLAIASVAALLSCGAQADDHSHEHSHAASSDIYDGYFEDSQVADRDLSDWQGDWRSVYPLVIDGTLDPVMAHKAETGDKSADAYKAYYTKGYATDVARITIEGETVTFYRDGVATTADYASDGYEVLTYAKGNRGVRFIFEKTGGATAAPRYIQFSDHRIFPSKADHYHLYWGDDRAAVLQELSNWPTYFPSDHSDAQIVSDMLAH
ncbi:ZinT family metal-binding protein [Celeribacter neptunius]|uniref:Zinc transport system substrate-binding protein n=1 Tax=Celeribacter neptunius TaxID=588602 RepID=A0A1I3LFB5_9RHOB|nr:metal-binding protein ZinT [Celeribacter neptunius]SFI83387.1 zinc transport system substrate-binding protein [Celeribacter neptunius]